MANLQGKKRAARIGDTNHPSPRMNSSRERNLLVCHSHLSRIHSKYNAIGWWLLGSSPPLPKISTPQMVSIPVYSIVTTTGIESIIMITGYLSQLLNFVPIPQRVLTQFSASVIDLFPSWSKTLSTWIYSWTMFRVIF
jgi:hypothetical protein